MNISTALTHALDDQRRRRRGLVAADQVERWRRGCWLAVRLHAYWQMSGLLGEGRQLARQGAAGFPGWSPERAWALGARGRLVTFQGDPDNAIADITESIRLAGELDDELAAARGYLYLNLALTFAGQYEQALAAGQVAAERLAACDDRLGLVCLQPQTRAPAPARPGTSTRPWSAASAAWRCWATSGRRARSGGSPARSA